MKKLTKILSVILTLVIIAVCFAGCSQKTKAKLEYEIENDEVIITGYTDSTERTEIVVPDEIEGYPVTEIADFGLFNAESLTKITIGKNVKTIGSWAMTNNQRLQEFAVDEENEYFTAVDGILFTKDMKTIIYYPNAKGVTFSKYGDPQHRNKPYEPKREDCKDDKEYEKKLAEYEKNLKDFIEISYVIPDGVETISSKAFYKCYYIDHISIPDSVTRIEEKAFHHCESMEELDLPANLEYIGKDAFAYCYGIKTATIPSTIQQIDEYAFFFCDNMKELNIEKAEDEIKLGKNWYPTNNGRRIKECEINWK